MSVGENGLVCFVEHAINETTSSAREVNAEGNWLEQSSAKGSDEKKSEDRKLYEMHELIRYCGLSGQAWNEREDRHHSHVGEKRQPEGENMFCLSGHTHLNCSEPMAFNGAGKDT